MDFGRLEIQDLLEGYKRKDYSPTEVVKSLLSGIEEKNPTLNAFLELRPEETLQSAKALEDRFSEQSRLPLFGIPVAVKDNFLIHGWKTTAGSRILSNYVAPYTATCVERLEAAGAIVIGKTNLDEFAMGSSTENSAFGPAKNPWDLTRVPGGSSGGSAVAVAAGLAPISLGTDTGGSIRQPASFCGLVGVKPTYGRVSRYGVIAFASSLDQAGPFARSVWDAARCLEVMAGYGGKDSTVSRSIVPKYTDAVGETAVSSVRSMKVGVYKDWMQGVQPEVAAVYEQSMRTLEAAGVQLVDIELPHTKYALSIYYIIAPSEASSNLARYDGVHYGLRSEGAGGIDAVYSKSRAEGLGPEVKMRIMLGTYALSSGYYEAYYNKATLIRRLLQKDFESAFEQCDAILSPTSPTTAFKIGEKAKDPLQMYLSDVFTMPANLAGIPSIGFHAGLSKEGLPIGMQLMASHFQEEKLFRLAYFLERERGPIANPPWKVREKKASN